MGNKRILGEIVDIKPLYEECNLLYVTLEQYRTGKNFIHNPAFWITYKGILYYAICSYNMRFLEQFEDWTMETDNEKKWFNYFNPEEDEFNHIMKKSPIFYEVEFDRIANFRDEFSQHEEDMIEPYRIEKERNDKINDIL